MKWSDISKIVNTSRSQGLNPAISRFQSSNDQSTGACAYPPLPTDSPPSQLIDSSFSDPRGQVRPFIMTTNLPFLLLRKFLLPFYLAGSTSFFNFQRKYHFLREWYPNPKYDPLIHVSKAPKSFPLHPSCSVITHWIVFPPLILPSPLNYKQYRDHICLLFTFYLVPNTQQYTTNVFKQMRKWDIGTV